MSSEGVTQGQDSKAAGQASKHRVRRTSNDRSPVLNEALAMAHSSVRQPAASGAALLAPLKPLEKVTVSGNLAPKNAPFLEVATDETSWLGLGGSMGLAGEAMSSRVEEEGQGPLLGLFGAGSGSLAWSRENHAWK
jgi:hypothetical protein